EVDGKSDRGDRQHEPRRPRLTARGPPSRCVHAHHHGVVDSLCRASHADRNSRFSGLRWRERVLVWETAAVTEPTSTPRPLTIADVLEEMADTIPERAAVET